MVVLRIITKDQVFNWKRAGCQLNACSCCNMPQLFLPSQITRVSVELAAINKIATAYQEPQQTMDDVHALFQ